tara:strand:+ start:271 stop:1410 length:1140 start_codon:yes stop_codon:yes gene_type:complete
MSVSQVEKDKLYKQLRHSLGAPIRKIQLTDEMMCSYLEIAIQEYANYVQSWVIDHQWSSIYNLPLDSAEISTALSTRSTNFESQYSYAYSKQVGLQARGPWELKKDYITIEPGKQVYTIPAGREMSDVLFINPPSIDHALYGFYGGIDTGFGGGFSQMGAGAGAGGAGAGGQGGYYIAPAFDVLMSAADIDLKQRLLRSDLMWKVTAGPDGTRLLHLISTPGSRLGFGGAGAGAGGINLNGCYVWYNYYDTSLGNGEQCRDEQPNIIMPFQVPLGELDYSKFNAPAKETIRQIFFGESKKALAQVRGYFSGKLMIPNADATMDYQMILEEGRADKERAIEDLKTRLERLSPDAMLERKAAEVENLNRTLKGTPLTWKLF